MHVLLVGPGDDDMHAQALACTHGSQRELSPGAPAPGQQPAGLQQKRSLPLPLGRGRPGLLAAPTPLPCPAVMPLPLNTETQGLLSF